MVEHAGFLPEHDAEELHDVFRDGSGARDDQMATVQTNTSLQLQNTQTKTSHSDGFIPLHIRHDGPY
jgi:hypothetical protein